MQNLFNEHVFQNLKTSYLDEKKKKSEMFAICQKLNNLNDRQVILAYDLGWQSFIKVQVSYNGL